MLVTFFCKGQDIIRKTNGKHVTCKIMAQDSLYIYFVKKGKRDLSRIEKSKISGTVSADTIRFSEVMAKAYRGEKQKREFIILQAQAGKGLPRADFGKIHTNNEGAGAALNGPTRNISASLMFHKNVGFAISYSYQKNAFSQETLSGVSTNGSIITVGDWLTHGFFSGLVVGTTFNEIRRISFLFSIQPGVCRVTSPAISHAWMEKGTKVAVTQQLPSVTSFAFGYRGYVDMRVRVVNNFDLCLSAGYLRSHPVFNGPVAEWDQKVRLLNVTAGLCISLYN